ncbi:MAG: fumarylacetoacetate hydrolase family protein [Deltaproteobacteria bacterium]|nr:fumarylacetoacetate hydrolase family protein [Deltaproteobacteria bacterium]
MILATRPNGTRDGELVVVSSDRARAVAVPAIAPTLQALLDDWDTLAPRVEEVSRALAGGLVAGEFAIDDDTRFLAPLPRAHGFADGSAYINHIVLVRKARGAEPPPGLETDPLVYQGTSDPFLAPSASIPLEDEAFGCDFESEVAVLTGDVPQGTRAEDAGRFIRLVLLLNDVTLRELIPPELAKGFGFFVSKPQSALSPFVVTPSELGDAWRDGRVHLPLETRLNGELFGDPHAGPEMHFSFHDLIAHVARTRPLGAGTVVGSGTVSNVDRARGSSCIVERRMLEILDGGQPKTPYLRHGDRVTIEMRQGGVSVFGRIDQRVVKYERPA